MRTLDSRLNELERAINTDNGQGLPCFIYTTREQDNEQDAKLKAYEEYKARNVQDYPQLETMSLEDLMAYFKGSKETQVVHIMLKDFSRKEGEI